MDWPYKTELLEGEVTIFQFPDGEREIYDEGHDYIRLTQQQWDAIVEYVIQRGQAPQ